MLLVRAAPKIGFWVQALSCKLIPIESLSIRVLAPGLDSVVVLYSSNGDGAVLGGNTKLITLPGGICRHSRARENANGRGGDI